MEDESRFYALLGRALMDPDYRARVLDKGQQADALMAVGIEPDDDMLQQLNDSIDAINALASSGAFGEVAAVT
jgi:hypothetical protein